MVTTLNHQETVHVQLMIQRSPAMFTLTLTLPTLPALELPLDVLVLLPPVLNVDLAQLMAGYLYAVSLPRIPGGTILLQVGILAPMSVYFGMFFGTKVTLNKYFKNNDLNPFFNC